MASEPEPVARRLAEIAMDTIHHDAQEPERTHELDELERRFRRALSGRRTKATAAALLAAEQRGRESAVISTEMIANTLAGAWANMGMDFPLYPEEARELAAAIAAAIRKGDAT